MSAGTSLSLGFMPQTSLSVPAPTPRVGCLRPVSGVHAPDFVERCENAAHADPPAPAVSGVHAPDFVERSP